MIEIKDKKDCCGCYACYNICPRQCIEMKFEDEGFWYPEINKSQCINCNLCEKVCPIINPIERKVSKKISYAAMNRNEQVRLDSSFGGIFSILAEDIIKNNGVIYGASFDKYFDVKHRRIISMADIELLRGSKYVQSSIGDIYKQVKVDLENNKQVLFTGTPCQVEGLKSFLRKKYDNLIAMDFICHGVPSPMIWKRYIEEKRSENNKQKQIRSIYFRNKDTGWKLFSLKIIFDKSIYINNLKNDLYMKGFLQNLYLRQSCYNCKFKQINRVSDITVADFWGIDKVIPKMDDDKGISLVVLHNKKGENLFNKVKNKLIFNEVKLENSIRYNKAMTSSVKDNEKRNDFFRNAIQSKNITKLIDKYTKISILTRIKRKVKYLIKLKR